jgi:hypothetical protein
MPADDLALEWLDYPTLARRLGTTHDAARQRAKRGRWARRRDNAGFWQVGVPVEALDDRPRDRGHEGDPPGDHDHVPASDHKRDQTDVLTAITTTFTRHIDRLEQALAAEQENARALERERDDARAEAKAAAAVAAQVEALNTVLGIERERAAEERRQAEERIAAERQRAEDWKLAADRFASQAEKITEAVATMRRPWWRRLAG